MSSNDLIDAIAMVSVEMNSVEDIEGDVTLPPITQETIFLDLDAYARVSYNALQAAIAINAIDSERVGTVG